MRSVLLIGATGLVGRAGLERLLADAAVDRVVVAARRAPDDAPRSPKLTWRTVDFDRLDDSADAFTVDQVICALGTTIKVAGSQARFRQVDHDYPLAAARLALARGASHFLIVSALGADATSRVFYNRVKGEVERDLLALPFRSITIVRPSLLLGERRPRRLGEEIAKLFTLLVPGRWRPIRATDVATALVRLARDDAPGQRIVESAELRRLARDAIAR